MECLPEDIETYITYYNKQLGMKGIVCVTMIALMMSAVIVTGCTSSPTQQTDIVVTTQPVVTVTPHPDVTDTITIFGRRVQTNDDRFIEYLDNTSALAKATHAVNERSPIEAQIAVDLIQRSPIPDNTTLIAARKELLDGVSEVFERKTNSNWEAQTVTMRAIEKIQAFRLNR